MRQEHFVERHQSHWRALEQWLDARADKPRRARGERWHGLPDEDVPAAYRRLCQHLALARRRGYSPQLTERLQTLMQRGHNALYRPPLPRWRQAGRFLLMEFPRLVRAERGCMLAAALLFWVPLVAMFVALQLRPELVNMVFDPDQLAQFEQMYDPANSMHRIGRESESDVMMFGHYILNNISIGFRSFASGLFAGIGPAVVLGGNGVVIGGVAGHLQGIGSGGPFWRFVAGHSALELTAIVISGGAGLRLGLDLLAPGRRRRGDALAEAGRRGARLCIGVFAMLLMAAFVEAFWSSIGWMPAAVKFGVGGVMWLAVLGWLGFGGRGLDAP